MVVGVQVFSMPDVAHIYIWILGISRRTPRYFLSIIAPSATPLTPIIVQGKTRSALQDVVTREYTIHLHKLVHGRSFKKRAPTAVKSVVAFAQREMGTTDVRIDPKLNQALWARGIKSVPHRIRVKLERETPFFSYLVYISIAKAILLTLHHTGKRNDEENAKEKLYTYASHVLTASFKVRLLEFLLFG